MYHIHIHQEAHQPLKHVWKYQVLEVEIGQDLGHKQDIYYSENDISQDNIELNLSQDKIQLNKSQTFDEVNEESIFY